MARFGSLLSLISATLVALSVVHAAPLDDPVEGLTPAARDVLLSARAVPDSPHWVAYFDKFVSSTSLPAISDLSGFNVFALAFIFSSSVTDNAATWSGLDAATRASIKAEYAAAGISLVVSAFGSTYNPTSAGDDPTAAANYIANYVLTYGLDGVDVDYEDDQAVEIAGTGVAWLTTFTTALRAQLPQGQYIITHAPVAPWFSPGLWPDNAYLGLDSAVGSLIDWYNIQFYNQGVTEYTTCDGLLTTSSSMWPESALFQIAANGVSLNKLVIGKPATTSDAGSGYMDPATLSTCLVQAAAQGWSQSFSNPTSRVPVRWSGSTPMAAALGLPKPVLALFPVGGTTSTSTATTSTTSTSTSTTTTSSSTITTTSTTTSTSSTSTSTSTSISCAGVAAWDSSVAYQSGAVVTYSGSLWTATQWNDDEVPGGSSDAWAETATC
ncbi:Glycoside hydrolase [Mycena sanguinolenta]|uniref:Glycoside hydrolase n=1 Tax=Mycena sanguinolenta TaxID=230812 RepID=A0A8H6XJK2_9AGAR|nr:Glycoside hydrolase [Mycena sanguinolenta]